MTATPRISVLISSFNSARFVAKKLREIRAQTLFQHAEFLFIETGSPQRERDLFAPFCAEHSNARLITTHDRRTLYAAWNLGWEQARAPLLCYTNMDDTMHPRLLECIVTAMGQNRWDACAPLIAKQWDTDPQLDTWSPSRLRKLPLNTRPGPFTAWRKSLRDSLGMFDGAFIGAGDIDFWARLVEHRARVGLVPKILYLYTKSAGQLSKSAGERKAHDQALLAAKPYPIDWHRGWQRRVRWLRPIARVLPGPLCVNAPEASPSSAA